MRVTALAGLFACAIIAATSSKASAESLDILKLENKAITVSEPILLASISTANGFVVSHAPVPPKSEKPAPIRYKVVENDSLSTIAERHSTTWNRLFNKNESIKQPDLLIIGTELTVPATDEILAERPLPESPKPLAPAVVAPKVPAPVAKKRAAVSPPRTKTVAQVRGSSSGNTYTAGYCTWYVKNKRPDLPNNLGNADTWVARAAAQGFATGSTPRVGAVGQRGMHVVYVEAVNGDGTVNISEMNHAGLYVITNRTLPANYFSYIY